MTRVAPLYVLFIIAQTVFSQANAHDVRPIPASNLQEVAAHLKLPSNVIEEIESSQTEEEQMDIFKAYFQSLQSKRKIEDMQKDYFGSLHKAQHKCRNLCGQYYKEQQSREYCAWMCYQSESRTAFENLSLTDVQLLFYMNIEHWKADTVEKVLKIWNFQSQSQANPQGA